jgi:hypothetical protein
MSVQSKRFSDRIFMPRAGCRKNVADKARAGDAIAPAFCWANLRRKFFDIAKGGSAPMASEALERIAALYVIEKTIRGKSADECRAVRRRIKVL